MPPHSPAPVSTVQSSTHRPVTASVLPPSLGLTITSAHLAHIPLYSKIAPIVAINVPMVTPMIWWWDIASKSTARVGLYTTPASITAVVQLLSHTFTITLAIYALTTATYLTQVVPLVGTDRSTTFRSMAANATKLTVFSLLDLQQTAAKLAITLTTLTRSSINV